MLDFTLQPLNITINQVSIGNKKLTKTIFNQIEVRDCFDENLDFIGDTIIGYVKEKDIRYLLWVIEGKLRKSNLKRYYLLWSNPDFAPFHETEWFLDKVQLKHNFEGQHGDTLSRALQHPKRYSELVDKAKEFLGTLVDRQIYI